MKPDYLTLSDETTVRVEFNMNALGLFRQLTGMELQDLSAVTSDIFLLRTLAFCCVSEGEAAEGREFKLTEIEFGRVMDMTAIREFSAIITKQLNREEQKKNQRKEKPPQVILRQTGGLHSRI